MATRTDRRRPPEAVRASTPETQLKPAANQSAVEHPSAAERSDDLVLVGRITGAWGVDGWVRVTPFNDPRLSLLVQLPEWWLQSAAGRRAVRIEHAKPHGSDDIVAKIVGVDDRDAAFALRGLEVLLSRAQFPALDEDEVYWTDLIGCTVTDLRGESLGAIVAIEAQPAHPLMRVLEAGASPREHLIPLLPEFVVSIDLDGRIVVADWQRDY